jgi:hypothetical protein
MYIAVGRRGARPQVGRRSRAAGLHPKQLEYGTGGPPILSHLYTRELLVSAFAGLSIGRVAYALTSTMKSGSKAGFSFTPSRA